MIFSTGWVVKNNSTLICSEFLVTIILILQNAHVQYFIILYFIILLIYSTNSTHDVQCSMYMNPYTYVRDISVNFTVIVNQLSSKTDNGILRPMHVLF